MLQLFVPAYWLAKLYIGFFEELNLHDNFLKVLVLAFKVKAYLAAFVVVLAVIELATTPQPIESVIFDALVVLYLMACSGLSAWLVASFFKRKIK